MTGRKLFITNAPAFYKLRLYHSIATRRPIFVIFLNNSCPTYNYDFTHGTPTFPHITLEGNIFQKTIALLHLIRKEYFDEAILGGWNNMYYWIASYAISRHKLALALESSFKSSSSKGIKALGKRIFLRRMNKVYASGPDQLELARRLNYKRNATITGGVGLITPPLSYECRAKKIKRGARDFLFVGRLVKQKNLETLIKVFHQLPDLKLHIVGYGKLEDSIKLTASNNLVFHGAINNVDLWQFYTQMDALVLPSLSEPWGLVVQEALAYGMPVILSDKVGCASQVMLPDFGEIFSSSSTAELRNAIIRLSQPARYHQCIRALQSYNYIQAERQQVESYL